MKHTTTKGNWPLALLTVMAALIAVTIQPTASYACVAHYGGYLINYGSWTDGWCEGDGPTPEEAQQEALSSIAREIRSMTDLIRAQQNQKPASKTTQPRRSTKQSNYRNQQRELIDANISLLRELQSLSQEDFYRINDKYAPVLTRLSETAPWSSAAFKSLKDLQKELLKLIAKNKASRATAPNVSQNHVKNISNEQACARDQCDLIQGGKANPISTEDAR